MKISSRNHKSCHLKLQPYKQNSVALRRNLKLSSRFYGPYSILKKVGQVAYELELPPGSKIHPVFHVSLLKKSVSPVVNPDPVLPLTTDDGLFQLLPSSVTDSRVIVRGKEQVQQFLVRWGTEKSDLYSWEDAKYLKRVYPEFNPWGQGCGNEGGIVVGLAVGREFDRNCDSKSPAEKLDEGFVELGNQDRILEIEDSSAIQNSIVN